MTNILKAKIEDLSDIKVKVEKATDVTYNTDHAKLDNLDYESSGHIGFASKQDLQEGLSQKQDLGNYVTEESLAEKDYASNSDLELKADKTYVDSELELKQDKGDYITRDEANEDHTDLLNQANAYTDSLSATKVDKEEGKGLSSNDFTDDLKNNLNLNTASRHSHTNKDILDNTTSSFTKEYKAAVDNHIGNTLNPHNVTKEQVGLSNVDNTRDIDKPVSTAQNIAIDSALNQAKQYADTQIENKNFVDKDTLDIKLSLKVDKEDGKGLSSNDFTSSLKSDLEQNTLSRHSHANKEILDNTTEAFNSEIKLKIDNTYETVNNHISDVDNPHSVTPQQIGAEPAFSKNTAFNKNFGTSEGTVCEGNDSRLSNARPASDVYDWAKQPTKPTYTKAEIGLENVDNTSDTDKPVSTAQAQAIADAKATGTAAASIANTHIADKNNPHAVTKEQVGLSNVDNVRQYSEQNPPDYPVKSVDGLKGDVVLKDIYVPKTFLKSYYWQKTGSLTANLVEQKPDVNANNYLEITTTNTTFDFANQSKITISKILENNISISNQQGITSTIVFAFSRNANVEFAGRVYIDDTLVGNAQTFAYIQYSGGNTYAVLNELIFTLKFNALNVVTEFTAGQTLKVEIITRQNNTQNLTTRYYCGVNAQDIDRYCISGLNLQGVEISTNQIADNSITLDKLNTEVKDEINSKQPSGNYATVDQLSNYATNTALVEGLAQKQQVGDYALKSDLDAYVTDTELEAELAQKQPIGDYLTQSDLNAYATKSELDSGLSQKQPVGDYATKADLETKQDVGNYAYLDKAQAFNGLQEFNDGVKVLKNLTVEGDIIQNGTSYITHAEEVYSKNDYITLREGALSSLVGYSGFKILKYDGVNTGILAIDSSGVIRVGDEGDEQPVATREESPIDGGFAKWEASSQRFITTTDVVTQSQLNTKYTKPSTGIPESDLSSDVQEKLNNASGGSAFTESEIATLKALLTKLTVGTNITFNTTVEAPAFNDLD